MHTNRGRSLSCANTYGLQLQPMNATQKADFLQRIEQAIDGGAPGMRTLNAHKLPRFFGAQRKSGTGQQNQQRFFRGGNTETVCLEFLQPFGWLDGSGRHTKTPK